MLIPTRESSLGVAFQSPPLRLGSQSVKSHNTCVSCVRDEWL